MEKKDYRIKLYTSLRNSMDLNEEVVFGALLEGGNRLRKLRRFIKQWAEWTPPEPVEKVKPIETKHAIENDLAPHH